MPLLEPIAFVSAPVCGGNAPRSIATDRAKDMPLRFFWPPSDALSVTDTPQPLVAPSSISYLSPPPTPPGGPPPTPRRRAHNELSKSDPPTPPHAPPPTPRRRDAETFNSLSRRDLSRALDGSPPNLRHYQVDIFGQHDPSNSPIGNLPTPSRSDDFYGFNSYSRRDPPTPPSGPPSSPSRRGIFNDLSRRDPPTPPSGPPPSPQHREVNICTSLSRNDLSPSRKYFDGRGTWTTDETDLLMLVCRSGVKLGWYQIAGLFHGKGVDECRRKYREIQCSEETFLDQQNGQGCDSNDSKCNYEPLHLCIPTDDLVPGLSHEPSPAGSLVCDRLTIRSWEFSSDVERAVDFEMHKKKTITHLSDELNFALEKDWDSIIDRVQNQHAFSRGSAGDNSARFSSDGRIVSPPA